MLKIIEQDIDSFLTKLAKKNSFQLADAREKAVKTIIEDIAKRGDLALIQYARRFEKVSLKPHEMVVSDKEFDAAYQNIARGYLDALRLAIKNITFYHQKQLPDQWFETKEEDVVVGLRSLAVESAGVYVPGGRAPYPSSVLMGVIPAKVAGVSRIQIATPPGKDKTINPHILVAANELGIRSVYKVGGAQAIAALTFGTRTIPKVDKIVGPGNIYVTLAKKLVYGLVGIDKLAGPSEAVIIADRDADPRFVAADLMIQAEHDPQAAAILVTDSRDLAQKTVQELNKQIKTAPRKAIIQQALKNKGAILLVASLAQAAEISNRIAPEHLTLMVDAPHHFLERIKNAGAVFLGPFTPQTVGDYIAGANHILPTGGSARFASPLGIYDFMKKQSVIGYSKEGLKAVQKELLILTAVEGLTAHGEAVNVRFAK